ncbi:MFS transporter [Paenibacillus glycanilyticus]|nr:MFS transporter [Paenibacillus glycanilyticus]
MCAGLEIPIMIVLGAWGRKLSNHALMICACCIAFLYNIIVSFSTDSWQLIAAQLLQAVFVAIVMGNGLSYFSELLPHSPGMSSTIYYNGSIIGRLIGNLGGGIIAQYAGFRDVYWVCIIMVVLSFAILWRIRPQKHGEAVSSSSRL